MFLMLKKANQYDQDMEEMWAEKLSWSSMMPRFLADFVGTEDPKLMLCCMEGLNEKTRTSVL